MKSIMKLGVQIDAMLEKDLFDILQKRKCAIFCNISALWYNFKGKSWKKVQTHTHITPECQEYPSWTEPEKVPKYTLDKQPMQKEYAPRAFKIYNIYFCAVKAESYLPTYSWYRLF